MKHFNKKYTFLSLIALILSSTLLMSCTLFGSNEKNNSSSSNEKNLTESNGKDNSKDIKEVDKEEVKEKNEEKNLSGEKNTDILILKKDKNKDLKSSSKRHLLNDNTITSREFNLKKDNNLKEDIDLSKNSFVRHDNVHKINKKVVEEKKLIQESKVNNKDKKEEKNTQNDSKAKLVNIKDENLRRVINRALGKERNPLSDITVQEMETITKLDSRFLKLKKDEKGTPVRGIKNLSGLEYAKNLKTIKLSMNKIKDLTPIKNLTKLEFLEVYRNEISDLEPLRNLKNLQHLDIYNNVGIFNLEPISKLNKINWIDMHYCNKRTKKITYKYLGELTNLEFLSIDDNFVDDISFVKNLKNLKTLSCNNSYVTNLNEVQDLAADSFEDWSGKKFFNMYGQMLKDTIKVKAKSEGTVYKMKCPVTGADKYIEKIYKTYGITEGLPAISTNDENKNIDLKYNKNTKELELTVGKNTSSKKINTQFNAVLEYGMYSLKITFDITQDGVKDLSKVEIN